MGILLTLVDVVFNLTRQATTVKSFLLLFRFGSVRAFFNGLNIWVTILMIIGKSLQIVEYFYQDLTALPEAFLHPQMALLTRP